jgi:hypothetical protein
VRPPAAPTADGDECADAPPHKPLALQGSRYDSEDEGIRAMRAVREKISAEYANEQGG